MLTQETTLVPPGRLAALLIERRRAAGLTLVEMSQRSAGRFSPSALERVERGRTVVDDADVSALTDLYGIENGRLVPERSQLVLDLPKQRIRVGDMAVRVDDSTADAVLQRYVSLLYLLRNEPPGRKLTLRDDDLDLLGSTFNRAETGLRDQLYAIMAAHDTATQTRRFSRKLAVSAAGLLVGVTVAGSFVIIGSGESSTAAHADAVSAVSAAVENPGTASAIAAIEVPGLRFSSVSGGDADTTQMQRTSARTSATRAPATETGSTAELLPPMIVVAAEPTAEPAASPATQTLPTLQSITALISYDLDVLIPGWTITIGPDRVGYHGMTNSETRTIAIYVDADQQPANLVEVLMHEVGHAIDLDRMDDALRSEWVEMRQIPPIWWAGSGHTDFAVGAGDFAEAVAAVTTGSASHSEFGEFTAEQLAFVARILS